MFGFWSRFRNAVGGWLRPRFGRTSVEGAAAPAVPQNDLSAGLQSSAVWACCRLVSQSVGSLPGHVFAATPDGKVQAVNHPLYHLLTAAANPIMTTNQWLQSSVLHLMLYGNAYTLPQWENGEVFALWPVMPERVTIVQKPTGEYVYRVNLGGEPQDFGSTEILHFRIFSLDGVMGLSPIEYHRSILNIEGATRLYAHTLYMNGGRPAGVLSYPGPLRQEQVQNIRESWRIIHGGPQNAGGVVVLENGAKYEQLAIPPEQLEFIAQQKFSVEQIARIYGVPPHLIGSMDKPTYASVEQQALEFLQYTLQPIVISIEKTIQAVLLDPPHFYKLNLASFERSDIASRYAAYSVGRQWGWLSVNDIRELEDMNRIGPEGDIYLQALNMAAATVTAPPQPTRAPQ